MHRLHTSLLSLSPSPTSPTPSLPNLTLTPSKPHQLQPSRNPTPPQSSFLAPHAHQLATTPCSRPTRTGVPLKRPHVSSVCPLVLPHVPSRALHVPSCAPRILSRAPHVPSRVPHALSRAHTCYHFPQTPPTRAPKSPHNHPSRHPRGPSLPPLLKAPTWTESPKSSTKTCPD